MKRMHFLTLIFVIGSLFLSNCQPYLRTWDATITEVDVEPEIIVRDGVQIKTYRPTENVALVIVHATIVNLKPVSKFSTHYVSIVSEDFKTFTPDGVYTPLASVYCMNCFPETTYSAGDFELGQEFNFGFIFLIKKEDLKQDFIFKVQDEKMTEFTIPSQ